MAAKRAVYAEAWLVLLLLLTVAAQRADSVSSDTTGVTHAIPYFPSASDPLGRQGFARVANRSDGAGTVSIVAFDDWGRMHEPVTPLLVVGMLATPAGHLANLTDPVRGGDLT